MELLRELLNASATLIEKIWSAIEPFLTPIALITGRIVKLIVRSFIALLTEITNLF